MKKIFYILIPMMLVACGGQKSPQDGETDEEVMDAERKLNIEHRKKYHFEYQLVKDDDGLYGSIVVKGREAGDNSPVFRYS